MVGQKLLTLKKSEFQPKIAFVYEDSRNLNSEGNLLIFDGQFVKVVILGPPGNEMDCKQFTLDYKVEKMVNLEDSCFALKLAGKDEVALVDFSSYYLDGFRDRICYKENKAQILSINGDKDRLYSLVQKGKEIYLKIF